MRHVAAERRIDVIRESGIAHAWHAVADHAHARVCWQVQPEVDRVEERYGRTKGVASDDDRRRVVPVKKGEHRSEDRLRRPFD